MAEQIATIGGGCFWCVEAVFSELKGVLKIASGYSGGQREHPTYEQVCSGATGHAEVVQIEFDDSVLSFENLLEIFFHVHDPTTLNQQGNDVGTQYRSVIYFHSSEQEQIAKDTVAKVENSGLWANAIVTEISPFESFYPAEEYHQDYFRKNPSQSYCVATIPPKLEKLKKKFAQFIS